MKLGASLLSERPAFDGPRTRIFELRYPKDVLPPEYSAQVWRDGYYKTLGDFATREDAQTALDAYMQAARLV